jgi:hypothetical protein
MPTTPIYQLPYPAASDPADVPLDMRELADAIEGHGPGTELAYAQITANVPVTATTEAGANTIVTAPAVIFDGKPVLIEFYAWILELAATAGQYMDLLLFQDGASISQLGRYQNPAAAQFRTQPRPARRIVPTAASHTYSIRAYMGTGAGTIYAGAGSGPGTGSPAFIRITRA